MKHEQMGAYARGTLPGLKQLFDFINQNPHSGLYKTGGQTMELTALYEMQKALDARIIEEQGLEGVDLLPNTVLALQVEIAELANEWRGFKHWSCRRTPKLFPLEKCDYCGEEVEYTRPSPYMADKVAAMCKQCWEMTRTEYAASQGECLPVFEDYPHFPKKVPQKMLEEYVDCLHFFLSIARQLNLPADDLYVPDVTLKDGTNHIFTELLYHVGGISLRNDPWIRRYAFQNSLKIFNALGMQRLKLSWQQIAAAYAQKNKVNHDRQASGY